MSAHLHLSGSERAHPRNSVVAGPLALDEIIYVTLLLRRKEEPPLELVMDSALSREEFSARHTADLDDIDAVKAFANQNQLAIVRIHPEARTVVLKGSLGNLSQLFRAQVHSSVIDGKTIRTREGGLHLPSALHDRVIAVLGFDERPAAATFRKAHKHAAAITAYPPAEIARLMNFRPIQAQVKQSR